MRFLAAAAAAVATAAVLAPAATAVPLVVANGSTLVTVDTNNLGMTSTVAVTGMQAGETLHAIDQRPATGQLFGIGSTSRLYVLDPQAGAATQVGDAGAFTLNGTQFGTDFNPAFDKLRVVSEMEQNLRLNPDGTLLATDALLNPAGNVVAAAYSNNTAAATNTTLYDIDSAAGTLVMQGGAGGSPSPNTGMLTTVGAGLGLGTNLNEAIGFDIGADGVALATITTGGNSRLYGINLATGVATNLGQIGGGFTPYPGLAIMPARIRLTSGAVATSEGATAIFEVTRNTPAAGAVSVDYSTAAGTATSGEDLTPASGTLAWGAGESDTKTIAVPVAVDSGAEGDETFTVSLSNLTGTDAVLGAPATATATIAANEAGPTLQFGAATAAAGEGASVTLQVTRVGATAQPVSVGYATAPGSATESDYTPASGTLSWAAGDGAAKTITVPITDDPAKEGAESFAVNLANPAGGATVGTPATATVTIAASDQPPTLKLSAAKKQRLRTVRRKGVAIVATVDRSCKLSASVRKGKKVVGKRTRSLKKGKHHLRVKITRKQRGRLRARQKLTVSATCSNKAGRSRKVTRKVTLKR